MGDRGNIVVIDGKSKVYLYTHWSRYRLQDDLADALNRGPDRWDDGQYLARIIFDSMTDGHQGEIGGFGISSVIADGDETFIVDVDNQRVISEKFSFDCTFGDFLQVALPQVKRISTV